MIIPHKESWNLKFLSKHNPPSPQNYSCMVNEIALKCLRSRIAFKPLTEEGENSFKVFFVFSKSRSAQSGIRGFYSNYNFVLIIITLKVYQVVGIVSPNAAAVITLASFHKTQKSNKMIFSRLFYFVTKIRTVESGVVSPTSTYGLSVQWCLT